MGSIPWEFTGHFFSLFLGCKKTLGKLPSQPDGLRKRWAQKCLHDVQNMTISLLSQQATRDERRKTMNAATKSIKVQIRNISNMSKRAKAALVATKSLEVEHSSVRSEAYMIAREIRVMLEEKTGLPLVERVSEARGAYMSVELASFGEDGEEEFGSFEFCIAG